MFKKIVFGTLIAVTLATTGYAGDYEEGWNLSFKRDAFDKTVFPQASVYEEGLSISSSASVSVACGDKGSLIPTFGTNAPHLNPQLYEVEFKSGETHRKFTFTAADVPRVGKQLRLEGEDATAFIDLFTNAVDAVAYRTKNSQGKFTPIAAGQVFEIVRTTCPK